jgi:L-idonate 5-dehydrogenase
MKAIVIHGAKDLRIEERASDRLGPGQLRIGVAAGGICGTDLHYYNHGGFGLARVREPMILGHEVSGHVLELGAGVEGLAVGDLVAISPSRPCHACSYCLEGLPNHCVNMRFYGSAMPTPHIQGAFREELVADVAQCVPATGLRPAQAAMAEPLSVCLHATRRAGSLLGKRVLVTGCGPIGVLSVLAARHAGASEIVATDLSANACSFAERAGADAVIDVSADPDALVEYAAGKGYFDVLYECTGAQQAFEAGLAALRPRGIVVQLGIGADMTLPMTMMIAKELDVRGSFRFHEEFPLAVQLMQKGRIDVLPLITHTFPLTQAEQAFGTANDRSQAMKAQITFSAVAG